MSLREHTGINHGDPTVPRLLEGFHVPEFYDRALCAQTGPDAFFPDKGESAKPGKKTCGRCDVRDECLAYALMNGERFGIWGGLSANQRLKLKKAAA